ncbi:hypothetical protein BDV59DRAFT_86570 [Aspergillus ambiguus]|uniref:uncharacterized protein n=1 Tax=Aspergillus ambiguus TaxID=176160 RepID=UPI003CCCAA2D
MHLWRSRIHTCTPRDDAAGPPAPTRAAARLDAQKRQGNITKTEGGAEDGGHASRLRRSGVGGARRVAGSQTAPFPPRRSTSVIRWRLKADAPLFCNTVGQLHSLAPGCVGFLCHRITLCVSTATISLRGPCHTFPTTYPTKRGQARAHDAQNHPVMSGCLALCLHLCLIGRRISSPASVVRGCRCQCSRNVDFLEAQVYFTQEQSRAIGKNAFHVQFHKITAEKYPPRSTR